MAQGRREGSLKDQSTSCTPHPFLVLWGVCGWLVASVAGLLRSLCLFAERPQIQQLAMMACARPSSPAARHGPRIAVIQRQAPSQQPLYLGPAQGALRPSMAMMGGLVSWLLCSLSSGAGAAGSCLQHLLLCPHSRPFRACRSPLEAVMDMGLGGGGLWGSRRLA